MTFAQIADFIRKTYPTATVVEILVTNNRMELKVTHEEPNPLKGVTSLSGEQRFIGLQESET